MTDDRPADGPATSAESEAATDAQSGGRRDVVVPMELYKVVTVFSTLIAALAVVGGFMVLDVATNRGRAPASEVDVPIAILGVGIIALGGGIYAFSTRFRAQGMGKSKDDPNGESDNG